MEQFNRTLRPPITLIGKVVDVDNVPLEFAEVILLGTDRGIITDSLGVFKIQDVDPGQQVKISFLGMKDVILTASALQVKSTVVLEEDVNALPPVTIIVSKTNKRNLYVGLGLIALATLLTLRNDEKRALGSYSGRQKRNVEKINL